MMQTERATLLGTVTLCAVALAGVQAVRAEELGRGGGTTVTKAAWTWRIARTDQESACTRRVKPLCRTTTLTIESTSAKTMACVAQLRFVVSGTATPSAAAQGVAAPASPAVTNPAAGTAAAAKPIDIDWTENAGLQVDPGAATAAIVSEFPDRIDPQLSFAVCWTIDERDDADDGDAPFARAAPSACKVQVVSSPGLDDFFPSGSTAAGENGLVRVRIALPLADGPPKVLGVSATSGFLRIDRAALLLASRMQFKTNCPGTQRLLPVRFQIKD